jgi:hypothetical protein
MSFEDFWEKEFEVIKKTEGLEQLAFALLDVKLSFLEHEYNLTQNPLFAWEALLISSKNNLPLPSWVLSYLGKSAHNLLVLQSCKNMGSEIAAAIGLYSVGKGTDLSKYHDTRLRLKAVEMVIGLNKWTGKSLSECFIDVAARLEDEEKRGIEVVTVRNWYYYYKDILSNGNIKGKDSAYITLL